MALLFVGLQQLEGHVVAPQIFGHTLRINPLLVIFALLLGQQVYGIVGALLALPILSVLRETALYLSRHLTLEPWERTRATECCERVRRLGGRCLAEESRSCSVRDSRAMRYGEREALRDVSFDAAAGELVAVVGPNGAGKTTLLSILAGIQRPSAGSVSRAPREVGWVPQQPALYSKLSVAENLELFARLEQVADPARRWSGCSSRPACASAPPSRWRASRAATASA